MEWKIAEPELSKVKVSSNRENELFYHLIDGKALPYWMFKTVSKWYNQTKPESFNFHDFVQQLLIFFRIGVKLYHTN